MVVGPLYIPVSRMSAKQVSISLGVFVAAAAVFAIAIEGARLVTVRWTKSPSITLVSAEADPRSGSVRLPQALSFSQAPTTTSLIWITGDRSVYLVISATISCSCGPKPRWNASTDSQKM